MKTKGLELKDLLLVVFLGFCISALPQGNPQITIKDNNGYEHLLLFSRNACEGDTLNTYNAELWLNKTVLVNTTMISKLAFKDGITTYYAPYFKCASETYSADTQVLYFNLDENSVRSLQNFKVKTIRLVYKDDEFIDYSILTPHNFKSGLSEVLAITTK